MKKITLLLAVLALAVAQAWAAPVIEVDAEKLDFGQVDVGYPVTERFMVSGYDLTDDINLALTGRYAAEYEVTPSTITPEAAAAGVIVKVTYSPRSVWSTWATLVLSSADADDVTVSIVADPQRNGTIFGNNNQRTYTAAVGMVDYSVEVANFADAEIPTDPNHIPRLIQVIDNDKVRRSPLRQPRKQHRRTLPRQPINDRITRASQQLLHSRQPRLPIKYVTQPLYFHATKLLKIPKQTPKNNQIPPLLFSITGCQPVIKTPHQKKGKTTKTTKTTNTNHRSL